MDRKLRFVEKEVKKAGIPILDTGENPEVPFPRDMIDLEAQFREAGEGSESNTPDRGAEEDILELTELSAPAQDAAVLR
ncbi:hypothetical protein FKM82_019285 [Ascaphus truei]